MKFLKFKNYLVENLGVYRYREHVRPKITEICTWLEFSTCNIQRNRSKDLNIRGFFLVFGKAQNSSVKLKRGK